MTGAFGLIPNPLGDVLLESDRTFPSISFTNKQVYAFKTGKVVSVTIKCHARAQSVERHISSQNRGKTLVKHAGGDVETVVALRYQNLGLSGLSFNQLPQEVAIAEWRHALSGEIETQT